VSADAVRLEGVQFAYPGHDPVLDIQEFTLAQGHQLLLRGASGGGKSTLLGLIAGVLRATAGRVEVAGQDMSSLSGTARDRFRADNCGVIFQQFNLLPFLSVRDNIALGLNFVSRERRIRTSTGLDKQIAGLLGDLGLDAEQLWTRPAGHLSVGQQQRVAAARALIGRPRLLLADEPTSALDPQSSNAFLSLMSSACRQNGISAIVVSHDPALALLFDEVQVLEDINMASRQQGFEP
jgi:putative ABC transport system ATP-binding protein